MSMKDTHETILLSVRDANGGNKSGYISGTPLPGTVMQIKAATEPIGGLFTYEAYNRALDGDRPQGPLFVLVEDETQGKTVDDAYVAGTLGRLFAPLNGDELLMRVAAPGTGTGNAFAIGDILMVDDGTGLLVATTGASIESEPFVVCETMADVVAAGTLTHVMFSNY